MIRFQSPVLAIAIACGGLVSCSSLDPVAGQKSASPSKTTASKSLTKADPRGLKSASAPRKKSSKFRFPSFRKKTPPAVATVKTTPTVKKKPSVKKTVTSKPKKRTYTAKKSTKKAPSKTFVPKKLEESDVKVAQKAPAFGVLPSLGPGEKSGIAAVDIAEAAGELPADVAALPSIPADIPKITPPTPPTVPDIPSVPEYLIPDSSDPVIPKGE